MKSQIQKYKKIIFFLVAVVILLSVVLLGVANRRSAVLDLNYETIQTRNVEQKVTSDGYVEGSDRRVVFFTPNLKVTEIRFNVGENVNQDDTLAVLTTLDGRNITSEIKSPISGIITESNYKQNDIVSAVNAAGFTIVNTSSYKVELLVNENDIVNLKVGQKARITYPAVSIEDHYEGEVVSVYPDSNQDSAAVSYQVIVRPTIIPENLKLGMSASVEVTTATAESVLSIPSSYIVEKDDKTYLKFLKWTNEEKTTYEVDEREVTVGLETDEYIEIKSGANQGDEILEPNFEPKRLSFFGN